MGMLRQVASVAGRYDIPAQVLVEESMACGIGVCMTCVLPVVGEDGVTRMVRSCVDGPVFRGDLVRWDDVGTVPFDALGAPGWKPRRPPEPQPGGGPASTGPASTGPASTGPASAGRASTGPASTGPAAAGRAAHGD
jgi:dihydroorotate dehydrogenase electron transfer subunit